MSDVPTSTDVPELVRLGRLAAHHGQLEHAERFLARACEIAPADPRGRVAFADMLAGAGRLAEAMSHYEAALTAAPDDVDAALGLGEAQVASGSGASALARAVALTETHGDLLEAWWLRAKAHAAVSDLALSLTAYDRVLALEPAESPVERAHLERATVLERLGRLDEAREGLEELVRRAPLSKRASKHLALHLLERGEPDRALHELSASLERRRSKPTPARSVTRWRLEHDIEQLRYLASSTSVPERERFGLLADRYAAVLAELPRGPEAFGIANPLSEAQRASIGESLERALHIADAPRLEPRALSATLDSQAIEQSFSKRGIVVVDGLLSPEALSSLRRYCLESTFWFKHDYQGGYLGAFVSDGFACGLLFQIADELRRALPEVVGPHPLRQMWAYRYDSQRTGIGLHADRARVNVNFWLTPDEANLDPASGGLVVHERRPPADWGYQAYNRDPARIRAFLDEGPEGHVDVPHRQNRAVIFDSSLFHATAPFRFRQGFESRRINVTMLFGDRERA